MSPKDIDLSIITNGWQALVAIVVVLAFVVGPSVFAWLGTRSVRREMKPNHGSSLRDQQNRQEAALARIEGDVAVVKATQKEHGDALASLRDRVDDVEEVVTDPTQP